jgi:hypothetical protein
MGDLDGNESPPPTATMVDQTSKAPDQPAAQLRPTHSSIGGPIISSFEDISSPPPKNINGRFGWKQVPPTNGNNGRSNKQGTGPTGSAIKANP